MCQIHTGRHAVVDIATHMHGTDWNRFPTCLRRKITCSNLFQRLQVFRFLIKINTLKYYVYLSMQHWYLFDAVLWISDYTAEDSQQSLCKGLQRLRPRGLVSINTQITVFWQVSTWCSKCTKPVVQPVGIYKIMLVFVLSHWGARWVKKIRSHCWKVKRICSSVTDKVPNSLVIVTME